MKLRDLRPYTRRAIELTHGRVDQVADRDVPTWDGKTLHIGRLKQESHVLHEVGHWIVAPEWRRALPNYGLGKDPDGGPVTVLWPLSSLEWAKDLVEEVGLSTDDLPAVLADPKNLAFTYLYDLARHRTDRDETLAAVVTLVMTRLAGLPWAAEMRRVFGKLLVDPSGFGVETFWEYCFRLTAFGVDLMDPLAPFAARSAA